MLIDRYHALPADLVEPRQQQLVRERVERREQRGRALQDAVVAGLQPPAEATGTNECSSQQALGDLFYNVQNGGGCAGAHHTAGTCPYQSGWAQNSCCARGGGSFGRS